VSGANLSVERAIGGGYRVYASVARSFLDEGHVFAIGVDKSTGAFAAGVETRLVPDGDPLANINLSASIGRDPHLGAWMASARSRAGFGALSVRVFLDRNRDGVFDAGDQPLEGVAFTVNSVERAERTGRDGVAYLAELSPHAPADVAIAAHTLEDSQWDPAIAGARVMPRPGKAAALDVAVIATTEVEGTVTRLRGGSRKSEGAPAMTIQLVDAAGKVVQQTKTSYDGYYVMSKVRPGRYTVRLAGGGQELPMRELIVRNDEPLIDGVDFRLVPAPGIVLIAGAEPPARTPARAGRYVVQLGAFSVRANADALLRRVGPDRAGIDHRGRLFFVEAGPYATRTEADAARAALARAGFAGIVRPAPR
jgi:hypothetical protein